MAISGEYFERWNLWVERASGELTVDQAIALKQREFSSGTVDQRTLFLVDVRGTVTQPSEARRWVRWLEENHPEYLNRAAYVTDEPKVTGLFLLIKETFRERETEVFSDPRAAIEWLGLDPEECTPATLSLPE